MTDDRFNEILNGPLAHPMFMMQFNRVVNALRTVVEETGPAGAAALEQVAAMYIKRDNADGFKPKGSE
jgi:hypothetical protein